MRKPISIAAIALLLTSVCAEVFINETFSDYASLDTSPWLQSTHAGVDHGKFELTSGKFFGDKAYARGIKTSQDARFYALAAPLSQHFSNKGKTLVLQFSVKHEQDIDCGGGYVKLLPPDVDAKDFNGKTVYNIMFGPDICGSDRKVHVILNHKGENHLIRKTVSASADEMTHIYTLILKPDQTYQVLVDNKEEAAGKLIDDWKMLPDEKIKDPKAKKPKDWEEKEEIPDPEDKKPEGWDDISEFIDDKDAKQPEEWDSITDGEWEPPKISNPEWKGEWKSKMIKNPNYKGKWVHPMIDNPEYKTDDTIGQYESGFVGFDLWQVKSGTIFDNILVTDDVDKALEDRKTWEGHRDAEKKAKELLDEEDKKKRQAELKEEGGEGSANKKVDDEIDENEDDIVMGDASEDPKTGSSNKAKESTTADTSSKNNLDHEEL